MIENAVASTLMRLPVAELSALRKAFTASPGGLSLEGFVAAMLPPTSNDASSYKGQPQPLVQRQRQGSTHFRRQSAIKARSRTEPRRRLSSTTDVKPEAGGENGRNKERKARRKKGSGRGRRRGGGSRGGARSLVNQAAWAEWEGGGAGWSLSEEERIGVVTDLVELFQQVDHNGDQVMEWEEFTGFVIDQVLALTREAPRTDRLKVRSLGARDKPSVSRSSVRRVRYEKHMGCVFSCTGPVIEVWDPAVCADVAEKPVDGSIRQRSSGSSAAAAPGSTKGLFAYAPSEAARGFEIGSSATLPCPQDDDGGGGNGYGGSRRSLHGANPNKSRDGVPVNVVVLHVKYIKASNLLMVLRSDLTLAFFLAEYNFIRVGLAKTTSQQYVLEHCAVTGLAFTSGCDGTIQSFAIDTSNSSGDGDQPQQHVLVTATPVGFLRRHTDVVQDLLTVHGSEAEGGQRLVSCGLDRRVCVWDIAKGTFAQSKHGNRAAIRSLAFDPDDNLLLGAGVEGEVLAWDMWARLGGPLFRMQGHRSPILSVACAPGKGRAASLDDAGKMILWDTRRNASVDNSERYLCQVDCSSNHPTSLDIVCDDSSDYLRWSHIGMSVVTSGRYMKIYDAVDPRVSEPPLSAALYSQNCVSFVTCNGPFVTLWDACTGRAVRTDKAMEGDIMRACLDGGERRLLLASSLGEILVFRFLQGTRIRTLSPGHDGPVSGMVYIKEDKVIVTGGWDRSLRVYDEVPREGDPPLLRQVEGAHSSDINVVSVSQRLSLIASGSAGGTCKLWDFQLLSCEGTFSVGNEVLCLRFLEPYPLVAVGDAGGYVSIVPVSPWLEDGGGGGGGGGGGRCHALLRFANDQRAEGTIEGPAAVTCLTHTVRPALASGEDADDAGHVDVGTGAGVGGYAAAAAAAAARVGSGGGGDGMENMVVYIYTGDDYGTVRAWEVGGLLAAAALGCRVAPEEDLPRARSNYDPRRRFNRQAEAPIPPQDAGTPVVEVPESSEALMENGDGLGIYMGIGVGMGLLEDSDGVSKRQGLRSGEEKGPGVPRTELGGRREQLAQDTAFTHGVTLAGEWTPHSEAVVSLELLQDPPGLLTASRDRSVKIRALPIVNGPTATSTSTAKKVEPTPQDPNTTQSNNNDNNSDETDPATLASREPPRPPGADPEGQEPIGGSTDATRTPPRTDVDSSQTCTLTAPSGCSTTSTGTVDDPACSLSSKSTASPKPPPHGYDLTTLTLGRIADACRRDTYSFPVDLKGRGEGRAVEARAVLQAIEEIEVRKERRQKEQAALDRARGGAAVAAAAAATAAAAAAAKPVATATSAAAATTTTTALLPPSPPPTASLHPDVRPSSPALPSNGDENGQNGQNGGQAVGDPGGERPGTKNTSTQHCAAVDEPLSRSEPARIVDRGTAAAPSITAAAEPAWPRVAADRRTNSAKALHKASSTFGLKTTASASRLADRYPPSCPVAKESKSHRKKGDAVVINSDTRSGPAAYANMAVEEQRVKSLEASSKAAVRCARESIAIRELLEPTPFLLSQMPDALSSYPAITTILTKHGGVVSRPELISHEDKVEQPSSEPSSEKAQAPAGGRSRRKFSSSSCTPLHLSGTEGSRSSFSFDHPPGQEQPSLLNYSQEQGEGPFVGAGSCTPGGECNGGGGEVCHTGEAALEASASAMREVHCVGECYSTGISGERINVTVGYGTGGSSEEESGHETYPPHVQTAASRRPANTDPAKTRSTAADKVDAAFLNSSGAEDDTSEAPQSVAEPRKTRKGGDTRCGGGAIGGGGSDSFLDGVAAKVKTRHSPRRKLPAYLSASSNGFGAASRWGALSKAHLEFHRLGTAGILSSLSCLSLKRHFDGKSNCNPGAACTVWRSAKAAGMEMTRLRASSRGRQRQRALPPCGTGTPLALGPTDLDVLAQKHEQAQAQWKRRLEAFTAGTSASLAHAASGAGARGQGDNGGRTRLRKIRKGSLASSSSPPPPSSSSSSAAACRPYLRLQKLSAKQRRRGGGSKAPKTGKHATAVGDGEGWSLMPNKEQESQASQAGGLKHEAGGETNDANRKEMLRAKAQFGPYSRRELFALWRAFDLAKAFESRVDGRLLFKNPLIRGEARYRRPLMEVLCATARTGPVLLTRQDALLKLLPLLDRPEARTFIAAAKLAETDKQNSGMTMATGDKEDRPDDEEEDEIATDPETLRELRALFDLYDVDRSGIVDVKEFVAALKGNYSADQISEGMGDAITAAELGVLLSSLSPGTGGSGTASDSGTAGSKSEREGTGAAPEVDFDDFVRLFRGVF